VKLGPKIALASLVLSVGIATTMVLVDGYTIPTLIEELRVLTRVSFLVFMLVFVARPLHDLLHKSWTAWLVANRRYLGLSFAAWHLIHWPILGSMIAIQGWTTFYKYTHSYVVPAAAVLVVISIMAATSSNGAMRVLGKPVWSGIHTVGLYIIWFWMVRTYVLRLPRHEIHGYVYLGIAFAGLAFRLAMAARRRARGAMTQATS